MNRTAAIGVAWGTGSHYEETLTPGVDAGGSQLKWSDLHPSGRRVLPRGSPPASSSSEINWEDTLGGKFAQALQRLEGMLYALYGSRPAAYSDGGGGYHKCQWYDRLHPRCLWAAEVWRPRCLGAGTGCSSSGLCNGLCYDFEAIGEYAALGDAGGMGYPVPTVPIRSRSGDPLAQIASATHDATIFPVGSVSRNRNAAPHDPKGSGWFGATQPGRAGGEAWLTTPNGYTQEAGESVTVTWTKPGGVATPTVISLRWRTRTTGAWSAWTDTFMVDGGGGVYTATLAAHAHGTQCEWYIRYLYDDTSPANNDVERFEPGGTIEPVSNAYTFTWFTHFNPYAHGLPELLDNYGGVDVRHGTDRYEFDGSESVQPGLLNLARWTISALCGTTCTWSDTGCSEGDGHPGALHHSPRLRGADHSTCCVDWPIRFYWSGSNVHPHYQRGGKGVAGSPLDTRPLHNLATTINYGSLAARMTWAGIEAVYRDSPLANLQYGNGATYSVPPFQQTLWADGIEDAKVWAEFGATGLQTGHVIDPIAIQEIIDAVDYLVRYGAWTFDEIRACKKNVGTFVGQQCGTVTRRLSAGPQDRNLAFDCRYYCSFGSSGEGGYFTDVTTWYYPCAGCCYNATSNCPDPVCSWYVLDQTRLRIAGDCSLETFTDHVDTTAGIHCDPFPAVSWEECWNGDSPCVRGKCKPTATKWRTCSTQPTVSPHCHSQAEWVCVSCDGTQCGSECGTSPPDGCGYYYCEQSCKWLDVWTSQWISCTSRNSINSPSPGCGAAGRVGVSGLSYTYCTGPRCRGGWDDSHGNTLTKKRFDHTWHPELDIVATGPPGNEGSGNCLGDIVVCGNLETGTFPTSGFEEVRGVTFNGQASPWWNEDCFCSAGDGCPTVPALEQPPPLPGIGLHAIDGTPLCQQRRGGVAGIANALDWTNCTCTLSAFAVCTGDAAWVAVDLNLDGAGVPYGAYAGRAGTDAPYTGSLVPTLRVYDLGKNPATWMHACPCETWTGATPCT